MATYTTNYNLEKPAQTDIYNVDVFNANADKIDAGLTDKAEKTMLAPVETTNSASRSYAKGEYFVYNNVLCCATTAIAAGGTIAIGTNCSTAPVGGELKSLRDALSIKSKSELLAFNASGQCIVKFDNVNQTANDITIVCVTRNDTAGILFIPYTRKSSGDDKLYWYIKALNNDLTVFTSSITVVIYYVTK